MILVIATAGLVYELIMATVASYLLGDSVTQFSMVIGVYLSALGLGAYASRWVERDLLGTFVAVELAAALVGGFCAPGLFLAFSFSGAFPLILYATVLTVGILVGLELPLLIRILERQLAFKELIARALMFDYAGALVGSLAFSLVLVPRLGLVQSSVCCGLLNALVGLASTYVIATHSALERQTLRRARVKALLVVGLLLLMGIKADWILKVAEAAVYAEPILVSRQSPHQRIVLTQDRAHLRLYLNGNLQFSSDDEARYHEVLVHPAMATAEARGAVLVGGGGDGLAIREVLRWPDVKSVTLVDLDAAVTDLARHEPALAELNRHAFDSSKVELVTADAMQWFALEGRRYDVIILDFPDPNNYAVGKLYSQRFYRAAARRLAPGGALVVQSTSPLFARRTYSCVVATLKSVGFQVRPFHTFVPSFGDWGYVLATHTDRPLPTRLPPEPLKYLRAEMLPGLFEFPEDAAPLPAEVNRLDNQIIVEHYLAEWSRWN